MKKNIFILLLSAVSVFCLRAERRVNVARKIEMDSVVVTSTRTPLSIRHSPVVTRVISSLAVERLSTPTIESLLEREVAGVEFHQAGYGTTISFQGLDARYVLFMVDGERLAGETYGNIDFARIPMTGLDRIEIVRGASSVLYGSNAMGAVVNVLTRMPRKNFEINASLRYGGSYQGNKGDTLAGKNTKDDVRRYQRKLDMPNLRGDISVGFRAGALRSLTTFSANYTDAYKLKGRVDQKRHYDKFNIMRPKMVGGRPVMDPNTKMPVFEIAKSISDTTLWVSPDARGLSVSGTRSFNVRQKFDYALSERFRFELMGDYYTKERYDFITSLTNENPMSNDSRPWTFESYRGGGAKALMEHSPNQNNKIYLSVAYDTYARRLDSLSGRSTPKQRHTFLTPRLQWSRIQRNDSRLTTGLEMLNEQLNFDLNPAGYGQRKGMSTFSAFGQEELFITSPLSFVAGVRVEYNNRFGWSATPKVSAKYSFENLSLRANYSRGYRTPSLKEMYMEFRIPIPGQLTYIKGNDKLKAESNHYVSLSAEVIKPHYYMSATLYSSFFRNKIDVVGEMKNGASHLIYGNVDKSTLSGAELLVKYMPVRNLQLSINYNYTYRTDKMASEDMNQYIFPSPHTAVGQVQYTKGVKKFDLGATANVRLVGGKEYSDFMPIVKTGASMMSMSYSTGNYTTHAASCTTVNISAFASYNKRYDITLGVDNLLNYSPDVVSFNSALIAPRNLFVKLAFRL